MSFGLSSRSGLVHTSAPAIGFGWTGSHRCSGDAGGLWNELSLGFGEESSSPIRVGGKGWDRGAVVANGLWSEVSLVLS